MAFKKYLSSNAIHNNSNFKYRELLVSVFLVVFIATIFWTQSRVPALNEKAQLGDRINISAIAFDTILPVLDSQPLYERTYKAAVNWAYTNWKGMLFGFLLAAAFITLLQLLPEKRHAKSKVLNSFLGLIMGSPLGVCVNCATPIAQGLIHAGSRLETSLSMLLSSPTLNPIVLIMAFSLLPFHIATIKIVMSVVVIVFIIPLIVKCFSPQKEKTYHSLTQSDGSTVNNSIFSSIKKNNLNPAGDWHQAVIETEKAFIKNLFYIIRITLPFMLAAGLLGAFLVEIMPAGSITGFQMQLLTVIAFAVVGSLLPVPIAFDILIVNILLSSGLNVGLASVLLFSLGIFSIYPALIIGRSVSIRFSLVLFIAIVSFAAMSGIITQQVDVNLNQSVKNTIEKEYVKNNGLKSYNKIIKTCEGFNNLDIKTYCLKTLFSKNVLINDGINICPKNTFDSNENIEDKNIKNISLENKICNQHLLSAKARKASIEHDDIMACDLLNSAALNNAALIDECKTNYIRSKSLSYTSLDDCSIITNPSRQKHCRYMVIADRMQLKSETACELELSADMHRQCIDNLNAHITSEFLEIEKCNQLTTLNAQKICRSTVTSLQISNLQNYDICKIIEPRDEISTCREKVITQKALSNKDPDICQSMSSQAKFNQCYINAAIYKKQSEITNINLAYQIKNNRLDNVNDIEINSNTLTTASSVIEWQNIYDDGEISIAFTEHKPRNIQLGTIFKKTPATLLGINNVWEFKLTDFMEPFIYGKGIASGDFNNDNWPDLAFASNDGLHLYQNKGDGSFFYAGHIIMPKQQLNSFVVSFVDIDNDGWQDLFLTAYGGYNVFFKNVSGTFSSNRVIKLPKTDTNISLAAGFSDWNKDGLLDFVIGNWSYGAEGAFIPKKSQNTWYQNNYPHFIAQSPDEQLGETLSVLLSDLNSDSHVDLLIGNDRKYPDIFYLGDIKGQFQAVTRAMKIINETSFNTMSYESADFNNDLLLDVFSSDMSVKAGINRNYCESLLNKINKKQCVWLINANKSVDAMDTSLCASLQNAQREECYNAIIIKLAKQDKDKTLCTKLPNQHSAKFILCDNLSEKITDIESSNEANQLVQSESNKLLINVNNKTFFDATKSMGVKTSYWSWNALAADLDNDGWQDIYIGNGLGFGQQNKNIHSNVFYHNIKGNKFVQDEIKFGLVDYINTPSYTYIDFDLDGDLDIISTGVMSDPRVFVNQGTRANSISFKLHDNIGNKFCIGCKITINYNENKSHQIREIKLSGGFMSYGNPVAHFGVGHHKKIDSIKISWSTGEVTIINKSLKTNVFYEIVRHKSNKLVAKITH